MDLRAFELAVQTHEPVAIVLPRDDYEQLAQALRALPGGGEWDKERMRYRNAPIVRSRFDRRYLVEDTPDGPLIHMLP